MMPIYLVIWCDYDLYEVKSIYSTREEAEKHLADLRKDPYYGRVSMIDEQYLWMSYQDFTENYEKNKTSPRTMRRNRDDI